MNSIISSPKIFRCQICMKIDGFAAANKILKRSTSIAGAPGSGAGKGGGAGGAIKEGGGGLGMWSVAKEEGYFYDKQRQQLENLKQKMEEDKKKETDQKKQK